MINYFQKEYLRENYEKLPQNNLKEFYSAYLKNIQSKNNSSTELALTGEERFNFNQYYLIFDALKMLPNFKENLFEQFQYELKCWKKVVAIAKAQKEIHSDMTVEQIAQIFIFMDCHILKIHFAGF